MMVKLLDKLGPFSAVCVLSVAMLALAYTAGCGNGSNEDGGGGGDAAGGESGGDDIVRVDGSSTVAPISSAIAEEIEGDKEITAVVKTSGTSGGFKKFIRGETDINDASRPIKDSEIETLKEEGIEFIELKVAIDGLSVVINPENDWCSCMSIEQLKKLWEPGSTVKKWSDLDPSWPEEEIKLFGPDTESGTFEYFNEEVVGDVPEGSPHCREDYTPAVNDNVLVTGVAGDKYALGYFGYAYYVENKDKLKAIGIKADGECVEPTDETIEGGQYSPLSRPLFIYVNKASLAKPHVKGFVEYYLNEGQELVSEVGYVRLSEDQLAEAKKTFADATAE